MIWYTEKEIEKLSGPLALDKMERYDAALAVAEHWPSTIARCLVANNVRDLKVAFRAEIKYREIAKGRDAWIKSSGAIFDPHRHKWLVIRRGPNK